MSDAHADERRGSALALTVGVVAGAFALAYAMVRWARSGLAGQLVLTVGWAAVVAAICALPVVLRVRRRFHGMSVVATATAGAAIFGIWRPPLEAMHPDDVVVRLLPLACLLSTPFVVAVLWAEATGRSPRGGSGQSDAAHRLGVSLSIVAIGAAWGGVALEIAEPQVGSTDAWVLASLTVIAGVAAGVLPLAIRSPLAAAVPSAAIAFVAVLALLERPTGGSLSLWSAVYGFSLMWRLAMPLVVAAAWLAAAPPAGMVGAPRP